MFTPRDVRAIATIANEFRAVEADFPVSYIAVLCYIARHELERGERPCVSDVAHHVGIARPSLSRIIRTLSDSRTGQSKVGEERPEGARVSLKLVERIGDPVDHRIVRLHLTPKGMSLLQRAVDILSTHTEGKRPHGN